MQSQASKESSKVPDHLRPFLRPRITTEPLVTNTNHPYIPPEINTTTAVELSPLRKQLPPKRGLRSKLRVILLKEWPNTSPYATEKTVRFDRPTVMRMKDSDDYITARAANPRTGLISPSIGTTTPRASWTPESAGEALKYAASQSPSSPTPNVDARPTLRRANESRKISTGSQSKWRADKGGWHAEQGAIAPSPKLSHIDATAPARSSSQAQSGATNDRFIVHMPSAHEPQPYAYPGCTSKQIEAFERSRANSRCASAEASGPPKPPRTEHHGQQLRDNITVLKRRGRTQELKDEFGYLCRCDFDGLDATTFAPFSSPKTPISRSGDCAETLMKTIPSKPAEYDTVPQHVRRKPVRSTVNAPHPSKEDGTERKASQDPIQPTSSQPTDAVKIPHAMRLHHMASESPYLHTLTDLSLNQNEVRKCSLGCIQDPNSNKCIERRLASTIIFRPATQPLFDAPPQNAELNSATKNEQDPKELCTTSPPHLDLCEILISGLVGALEACKHIPMPVLPRLEVWDVLYSETSSAQEKVQALKSVLSSTGQALVLLSLVAALWQLGNVVAHIFEILFWPFIVPFRVLSWVVGAG